MSQSAENGLPAYGVMGGAGDDLDVLPAAVNGREIRQNDPVEIQTYPLNRLACWHSRRHLRYLGSTNGAEVYCGKCGRKRFGFLTRSIPPAADQGGTDA